MDDNKTNVYLEDTEKNFKRKVFDIFSKKSPTAYSDKDGLIVIPLAKHKNNRQLRQ